MQLAQAYDFDVYIDQYGREVVVDPRTGRVVEIREPLAGAAPPPPPPPPPREQRGNGWRSYDFTDPRDVERFHRDREAAITRGWDDYESIEPANPPLYEDDRYDETYGGPEDGDDGWRDQAPVARGALPPPSEDRSVRRDSLDGPQTDGSREASRPPRLPPDLAITVPDIDGASEDVAKFQVLLDRVGASPGVIDGRTGDNVNKAIDAYKEIAWQRMRTYDKEWIEAELERTGGPAFTEYTITAEDAAGPYIASVPSDYSEKAKLERLGYTRVSEMLAERFHMDEKFLIALNPEANFERAGTIIRVVDPGEPAEYEVARLVADKSSKQLRAYNGAGRLVAAYPATIGSADTPSPTGTHEVARVAFNPEYTYDPKKNFKQGDNDRVLTIPPGPNGPVGSVWIALSKPSYGIHGTPDPSKIGKTYSHGCVRLTNWDAEELAGRVKPGVTVEFVE
ncbi:L,D-transpeptidase [Nitratireductor sp. GCM10026969]|uniref:L,D-transpeptidase n=1 Tax=Nitratireductor sp. GCM10026969 TaxID=3252645 RepID=UPI003613DE3D